MGNVLAISDTNFESEVIQSTTPTVVDFWATWCGPCKALAPKIEQLTPQYEGKIKFTKLDVDENPKTSSKFAIRGVPTLIVFKNGQPVSQVVGDQSVENLKKFLNSVLLILLVFMSSLAQAEKIAGYEAKTWYPSLEDPSVQFMLMQDPMENCPRFYMRTTVDATPDQLLRIIEAYGNYSGTMPRMIQSQVHKRYVVPELSMTIGSQRKEVVTIHDAHVAIVTFGISIPVWSDFTYTLLLASSRDVNTGVLRVYWIQHNEKGFPNGAQDLYGAWTLAPLEGNRTSVLYENYIDPGFWTRLFLEDTILHNNLSDIVQIISVIKSQLR